MALTNPRSSTALAASTRRRTLSTCARRGYWQYGIHGEVNLWGAVVEHKLGWRAQYAYPKSFFLQPDALPFRLTETNSRLKTLTAFGIDIFIAGDYESICLWKKRFRLRPCRARLPDQHEQ